MVEDRPTGADEAEESAPGGGDAFLPTSKKDRVAAGVMAVTLLGCCLAVVAYLTVPDGHPLTVLAVILMGAGFLGMTVLKLAAVGEGGGT
jgi:hypothetical protein